MRTRILIIVVGVSIGFGLKLTLNLLSAPSSESNVTTAEVDESDPRFTSAETLVPPIEYLDTSSPQFFQPAFVDPQVAFNQFAHDSSAAFHPHGDKVCASGCALSNHPTEKLNHETFRKLMVECGQSPLDENNKAFEALLYYGRQTREFLEQDGFSPLMTSQARTLNRELLRTHALISIRVIDERGEVRSSISQTRVPFDRRHVFDMETNNVQPLVTSGTVKRVGVHHMWTRL